MCGRVHLLSSALISDSGCLVVVVFFIYGVLSGAFCVFVCVDTMTQLSADRVQSPDVMGGAATRQGSPNAAVLLVDGSSCPHVR